MTPTRTQPSDRQKRLTPEEREQLITWIEAGEKQDWIAAKQNMNPSLVAYYKKKMNVKCPE